MSTSDRDARTELAYMLWQFNEGYVLPEDRQVVENWMYNEVVRADDAQDRDAFLASADELLASDWMRAYAAEAAARALEDAAEWWPGLNDSGGNVYLWLRARAADLRAGVEK